MARTGSTPLDVAAVSVTRGEGDPRVPGAEHTVVWLHGEHDVATVGVLSRRMADAIAHDDADIVVDLSEVQFMGAATVHVIVAAQNFLRRQSRSLVVRAPARCARRILEVCGLAALIAPAPPDVNPRVRGDGALGTWVAVPTAERPGPRPGERPGPRPGERPATVAPTSEQSA